MTPALLILGTALASTMVDGPRPKVLIVGIDGLRPAAMVAADTPSIDALAADGCLTLEAATAPQTVSGPGWSNVLCGVWPDKHRVVDNRFLISDYERYPSVFTIARRARPAIRTAMFANWGPIGTVILKDAPLDVRVSLADTHDDAPQVEACVESMRTDDSDLVFAYIGKVDETGHAFGFHEDSPTYIEAIERADEQLGRILAAIEARPGREDEDWLVVLTTDHGGTVDYAHGRDIPEHRTIPFIVSGRAAAKGPLRGTVNQVDAIATALAHLGIESDPAWDLDGRPVGLARDRDGALLLDRNLLYNGDAERSSPGAEPATNRGVAGWRDLGPATTLAYGANESYPTAQTPGSPTRGRSFMVGGDAGESRLEQRIDLEPLSGEIDEGGVGYELSAWLGGYARQRDLAWVELRFLDERGGVVGLDRLAAATVEDRTAAFAGDEPTGFLRRVSVGTVPPDARVAEVTVRFERSEGACDGYADDISLVLHRTDR